MSREEGEELAAHFNMPFLETSAKATTNVEEAFVTMTKEIMTKTAKAPGSTKNTPGGQTFTGGKPVQQPPEQLPIELTKTKKKSTGYCCWLCGDR